MIANASMIGKSLIEVLTLSFKQDGKGPNCQNIGIIKFHTFYKKREKILNYLLTLSQYIVI